jgi:hypothetical protein
MMARIVGWTMLLLAILGACSPGAESSGFIAVGV